MAQETSNRISFTDNELKNITINAMGRASEAGGLPVHRLGMAANISGGIVQHTRDNNSGYSLGFFQHDYGNKRESVQGLVAAYNAWEGKTVELSSNIADRLYQNRDVINRLKKTNPDVAMHDIRLEADGQNINKFLASEAGYQYTMQLQEQQYDRLSLYIQRAMNSVSVQNMTEEEAVYVVATIAKIGNQAGTGDNTLSNVLTALENKDKQLSFNDYKNTVTNHPKLHVREGVVATGRGVHRYNALVNDQSKLGDLFRDQLTKNPFIATENVKVSPQEQLMDTMFRYPDQVPQLIEALNNEGNYQIRPDFFQNNATKTENLANEVYSIGVKDGTLFSIDKDGNAHKMDDKGEWIAFDNTKHPLVYRDHRGQWTTTPRDLSRGHKGNDVTELQEKLNLINPEDQQIVADGDFGGRSVEALKAFQEANKDILGEGGVTGMFNTATRALLDQRVTEHYGKIIDTPAIDDLGIEGKEANTEVPLGPKELPELKLESQSDALPELKLESEPMGFTLSTGNKEFEALMAALDDPDPNALSMATTNIANSEMGQNFQVEIDAAIRQEQQLAAKEIADAQARTLLRITKS